MDRRGTYTGDGGILVKPGEIHYVYGQGKLVSIVGPGVVICLWSEQKKIAIMGHYLWPSMHDPSSTTASYGNVCILKALEMAEYNTEDTLLEAQIFGGALAEGKMGPGEENVLVARRILSKRGIPLVSCDTGGSKGRKILLDVQTGHVMVLKVHKLREEDWLLCPC